MKLLAALGRWRSIDDLRGLFPGEATRVERAVERFLARGWLESSDVAPDRAQRGRRSWEDWMPSAALFHFDTKVDRYLGPRAGMEMMRWRVRTDPPPPALKRMAGRVTRLPSYARDGPLASVLLARRSWRKFGKGPVTKAELSSLLGLTWGIQKWFLLDDGVGVPLKTSPSGGGCHSIEAYVAVRSVAGLAPGIYHYRPDRHELVALRRGWTPRELEKRLAGQFWFSRAPVVVFMTSVFSRVQWKYRYPRAYRVVLLEAGHLCQTFCLAATELGLAPFCTAAFADALVEKDLGLDGVTESVIYAAGVGRRPPGVTWAPWWDAKEARSSPAAHLSRR
jgi:SagB-type dehydrogenase family enzyme